MGNQPNIAYIRTLGSLTYTLVPKEKRIGKLDYKANKGILVGFESSNNYLVYIPDLNKVISTKDILIKEDLYYKEEYITKDNYNSLLEELELREDLKENLTNLELNNLDSNLENISIKDNTNITPIIRDNTELEGEDSNITNNNNSDLDELNSEYYKSNIPNRTSKRIRSEEPENQGLSIYKLASQAYYTTLEEVEDIKETKIIALNNPNIIEPLDYKEASNSLYKEY